MPADACAGPVLVDADLAKFLRCVTGELGDFFAEGVEKWGRRLRGFDSAATIIVAKAKRFDAPLSQIAVKFERLQRQGGEGGREILLSCCRDEIGLVAKTLRQRG